jgi:ubiquinone/menaquinone biosynthesis C-methylase UbiE
MGVHVGSGTREVESKKRFNLLEYLRHEQWRFPLGRSYRPLIEGKRGLEVGGPSHVFKTTLPVYQFVCELDGVNFAAHTVWEGDLVAGDRFVYSDHGTGRQFIADATDLGQFDADSYDFLLSSNCLEHLANPLKALTEWRRVIKPGGALVLVLPNKKSNFDHRRPRTEFAHLLRDFENDTSEHDLTHLDEILALHDLSMDPPAGDLAAFRERSLENFDNRTLHHHVFDKSLITQMLEHVHFDVVDQRTTRWDFFALATKRAD